MEQREWRREMKETQGKTGRHKSNKTRRLNKPVFQYKHKQRGKKRIKNSRGTLLFSPEKKKRKILVWMIRTVPQWHQKSHCAVDICVSSLSCSNEKTNDRSIAAQTINVCAVHCSFVLFSFPGKKNRKKSNCNQNT
jgi:hypothetical protein